MPKPACELPSSEVVADPGHESGQRRRFTAEDKQRILTAADACTERGQLSALLREVLLNLKGRGMNGAA